MKIIDISWPITADMTQYKDRNDLAFYRDKNFEKDQVRSSRITLGSHIGTHVDAPAHFLKDGGNIETINLEKLIGQCVVLDLTHVQDAITNDVLATCTIPENYIVLFKTKNSQLSETDKFHAGFVYLEKSGAQFLEGKNIKAVGIDYLGIERSQPDHETHVELLSKNVPIIEGLRLVHVEPGVYQFCCLPLAVCGLEAAPARAVLIQNN